MRRNIRYPVHDMEIGDTIEVFDVVAQTAASTLGYIKRKTGKVFRAVTKTRNGRFKVVITRIK